MSEPSSILSLQDIKDAESLTNLLSILFEPSPPLHNLLVPSVLLRLTAAEEPPATYNHLIDICSEVAEGWTWAQKADFLSGHPVIGEVSGLSAMSGKEQGGATRKVVLGRLAYLNALYGVIFPQLRYITFVNGRPRSAIIPEMEGILGISESPQPLPDEYATDQPSLHSEEVKNKIKVVEGEEWKAECQRGLEDVWKIGRARLKSLRLG